jgi:putative drug exporter of the RND superfamily
MEQLATEPVLTTDPLPDRMILERLGRYCFRKRRLVVGLWLGLLVALGAFQGAVGSGYHTEFRLAGAESQRGFDLLAASGTAGSGLDGTIVFRSEQGVDDPAVHQTMAAMFDQLRSIDGVVAVASPYDEGGAGQIAPQGPDAGKLAFARVQLSQDLQQADFVRVADEARQLRPEVDGLQVELGGVVFAEFEPPESELLGLSFAVMILLVSFGSVLAMGLPVGVALFGVGTGTSLLVLASHLTQMPDFTGLLAAMIGLGVGIDYALFIVTRYREGVHHGLDYESATVAAIGTAGRAVLFAGVTVVISLLGMLLMGLPFVRGLAYGAAITVAMTMLASITLLPALLGFAKARVEITRYRGLIAAVLLAITLFSIGLHQPTLGLIALGLAVLTIVASFAVAPLRREVPRRAAKPVRETIWYRWSRVVQHRPWPAAIGGLAILLLLAAPTLSLRLGFSDEGNYPTDTTTRRAYDLLATGFGPGFNGPLLVVGEVGDHPEVTSQVTKALAADPGVAAVVPVAPPGSNLTLWQVLPTTAPQDQTTDELVHHLRDDVIDPIERSASVDLPLTGIVASNIDFADFIARRLPLFFAGVLTLSFLLLMSVFRSVLVPLKAVIVNLLSIGAAYGVVVAVFQWGWAKELVGIGKGGPIEAWVPMMMFAIVFGLSMDYEVFLLSRMREEYDRSGDNATAVADGLASTARVITAAAAIMVFVFGSFLLEADRSIKLFGVGLATAVLLDASVVRMLLVPATMELLGKVNWWLPRWLDRIIPRLQIERASDAATGRTATTAD